MTLYWENGPNNWTFSINSPALWRFWMNLSLHRASWAFLLSDLLSSCAASTASSAASSCGFPRLRRLRRTFTSHTSTKSEARVTRVNMTTFSQSGWYKRFHQSITYFCLAISEVVAWGLNRWACCPLTMNVYGVIIIISCSNQLSKCWHEFSHLSNITRAKELLFHHFSVLLILLLSSSSF